MSFVEEIKNKYAKSYHYFALFYNEKYKTVKLIEFEHLPFEYQFGVFVYFFNSVSTDVDIYSNEENPLKESISEAFEQYEEYLFLDS